MSKVAELVRNRKVPYVTIGLIVLNVVYYIILAVNGNPANSSYMLSQGADYAPYVFGEHQYWRLVTSMFMHFSFRHLAGNMIYLGIVGGSYERMTGHLKFLLIYFLSGLGGNVVSCAYYQLTHQAVVSAGASGAVYGVIAIVIYTTFLARRRFPPSQVFWRIGVMFLFLFYSNFASKDNVDVAAHIGGLCFGVLLCLLLLPAKKIRRKK